MRTLLITGGAGFFGSILARRLLADGFRCVSVDLQPSRPDVITFGVIFPGVDVVPDFPGYIEVARFEGHLYWQDHVLEEDTYIVFRKRPENMVDGRVVRQSEA
jgi:nucleoside-diphosphate-sugar epimerase